MTVYRICNETYQEDLSGTGAKLFGGRWNSKGIPMLYTSEHISLTLLEMLVHTNFKDFSIPLSLIKISLPVPSSENEIKLSRLKKEWKDDTSYTKFIGNEFAKSNSELLLRVPSVIVSEEFNVLINPLHKDIKKVKIIEIKSFTTDNRLFTI